MSSNSQSSGLNYKSVTKIGGGGFSEVFECIKNDGSTYAKKILKEEDDESIARFKREVRILNTLDHPNIVKVVAKSLSTPPYYFVMPRYQKNLGDCYPEIVGNRERVIPIFSSILKALDYAHGQRVIHRDLKPTNVLLNSDSDIVISDFGYGKKLDSNSGELTKSGAGFGTEGYACPEQWDNDDAKSADERCDIYTLGIMLYELFAGLLRGAHPELDNLPQDVRFLVDRCVRHNPNERFQSISEFRRSWSVLMEDSEADEDVHQLNQVAAELDDPIICSPQKMDQFLELLSKLHHNHDAISEALLLAGPNVMDSLLRSSHSVALSPLTDFCIYTISQDWPIDHAEELAQYCDNLLEQTESYRAAAHLIVCLLHLSVNTNHKLVNKFRRRALSDLSKETLYSLADLVADLEPLKAKKGYYLIALSEKLPLELRLAFETAILGPNNKTNTSMGDAWNKFIAHLKNTDKRLYEKLQSNTEAPSFHSQTTILQLKNCPQERMEYHIDSLEDHFLKANKFRTIIILKA